ncbi:unnamed protein product [Medioppia subpectinata]|jgi:hypothetical protein
MYP